MELTNVATSLLQWIDMADTVNVPVAVDMAGVYVVVVRVMLLASMSSILEMSEAAAVDVVVSCPID